MAPVKHLREMVFLLLSRLMRHSNSLSRRPETERGKKETFLAQRHVIFIELLLSNITESRYFLEIWSNKRYKSRNSIIFDINHEFDQI